MPTKKRGAVSRFFDPFKEENEEFDRQQSEIRKLQVEQLRRNVEESRPRFSQSDITDPGRLKETPQRTEELKKQIFNQEFESPDARIKALSDFVTGKTKQLKEEQPSLTRSEFIARSVPKPSAASAKPPVSTEDFLALTSGEPKQLEERFGKEGIPGRLVSPAAQGVRTKETRELKEAVRKQQAIDREKKIQREGKQRIQDITLKFGKEIDTDPILKKFEEQSINLAAVSELADIVKTGNTVAFSALGVKMARGMGEVGVLTEQDIRRYVLSGRLDRKAADTLSFWIKGKVTDATLDEIQQITDVIRDSFTKKSQPRLNRKIKRFSRVMGLSIKETAKQLAVEFVPTLTDMLEGKDIPAQLKVEAARLRDAGELEVNIIDLINQEMNARKAGGQR